ncbi:MAG: hypothetical protein GEU93_09455 [Propionibacteriales bacterium]|nr:hypothetical protein [Propionibacteriales bacterium]
MTTPRPRRPAMPGADLFDEVPGGDDPALRAEIAHRSATLLVRGARYAEDQAVVERIVHLADDQGLDTVADLWADSPADSLPGALWRLYLLRSWVQSDPGGAARQFDAGRRHAPVHEVVAGVVDPPGADEVRELTDTVLRGVAQGDLATTLDRAAAFARIVAAGRAELEDTSADAAARLVGLAEQLASAARAERAGRLS